MGCFDGCFGSSKDDKVQKKRNKNIPKIQRHGMQNDAERKTLIEYGTPERETEPVNVGSEQSVPEERFSPSPTKKRVTFNSNVKIYELVLVGDSTDSLLGEDKGREEFKENIVKLKDDDSGCGNDSITSSVGSYPPNHRYQNCRESTDPVLEEDEVRKEFKEYIAKLKDDDLGTKNDSTKSTSGSYPLNHRYQNCQESDNEAEEYGDSDLDDDDEDGDDVGENGDDDVGRFGVGQDQEVCLESVVTELEEFRTKNPLVRVNSEEVNSPFKAPSFADEGNGVKAGYARDRSTYIHSVLNPVENLSQWKAVKSKGTLPLSLKPEKENSSADIEAPRISVSSELMYKFKHLSSSPKTKSNQLKTSDQDVAVDASLSNWLVSPETTPVKKINRSSG